MYHCHRQARHVPVLQRLLHHLIELFVKRVSDDVLFLQPIAPSIVVIIIIDPLTLLLIITSPLTVGLENRFLLLELLLLLLPEQSCRWCVLRLAIKRWRCKTAAQEGQRRDGERDEKQEFGARLRCCRAEQTHLDGIFR